MELNVSDTPKMLRETLCRVQNLLIFYGGSQTYPIDLAIIQRLINECDRQRPLNVNGKHGNLHTPTCGCEDK